MSAQYCETMDCPICMDSIVSINNRVTTECGHCFHTSCLMTSVAHNGLACPYCRTAMAETPEEEEEEEDDWGTIDEDDEPYSDFALRGLRLFTDNLNGVAHDADDLAEEEEEEDEDEEEEEEEEPKPTPEFITQKLVSQGITMEQMVKVLLLDHEEYSENEEFHRVECEIFGKLRIIISNYHPEQALQQQQPTPPRPVAAPSQQLDSSAQPKVSRYVNPQSSFRIHV